MAGRYTLKIREFGTAGKSSKVSVHNVALVSGNITAVEGLQDDLRDAIGAVILGIIQDESRIADEASLSVALPTDTAAQRELKWLVQCVETGTGNSVRFEIPTADTQFLGPDGVFMDPTAAEYTALVDATEALVRSNDGVAVTVTSIKLVGRTV